MRIRVYASSTAGHEMVIEWISQCNYTIPSRAVPTRWASVYTSVGANTIGKADPAFLLGVLTGSPGFREEAWHSLSRICCHDSSYWWCSCAAWQCYAQQCCLCRLALKGSRWLAGVFGCSSANMSITRGSSHFGTEMMKISSDVMSPPPNTVENII